MTASLILAGIVFVLYGLSQINGEFRRFINEEVRDLALHIGDLARALWFWPMDLLRVHKYEARHRRPHLVAKTLVA
jgi:hypothetical protein